MKHIWKFTIAVKSVHGDWDLHYHTGVKKRFYTSLKKCRSFVTESFKVGTSPSKDGWHEEHWNSARTRCVVINSGGETMFSFDKTPVY